MTDVKNRKTQKLVLTIFVLLLFLFPFFYRKSISNDISDHSKFAIGKIIRFTTSLKSGDAWHYQFNYNNHIYVDSRPTHVDYDVKMGEYFLVNFSSKDPEHSKILYQYKLNSGKLNYIDSVWDTIPLSILHSGFKKIILKPPVGASVRL